MSRLSSKRAASDTPAKSVDSDTIEGVVKFDDHEMTDEQVEEILNA